MSEPEKYLRRGGWIQNARGWWHPPSCLASWPENEAVAMAKRDEAKGGRMNEADLREYLQHIGMRDIEGYIAML